MNDQLAPEFCALKRILETYEVGIDYTRKGNVLTANVNWPMLHDISRCIHGLSTEENQ